MNRCYGCMEEIASGKICPKCGCSDDVTAEKEHHLSSGTIIRGEYLVGLAIEEKEDCIVYIGYDFSKAEKVLIKEFFPTEYLFRTANDDVAEIKEGCVEDYEVHLGNFLKEHKDLASDVGGSKSGVYKCFLENNTCYVVHNYNANSHHLNAKEKTAAKRAQMQSFEKANKIKRNRTASGRSLKNPKAVAVIAAAVVALIFTVVVAVSAAFSAVKKLDTSLEAVSYQLDGGDASELEFYPSSDISLINGSYSGINLEKNIIGEAAEMMLSLDLKPGCSVDVRHDGEAIAPTPDGKYKINLTDSGKVEIISYKTSLFGLLKNHTSYSFNYTRLVFAKLNGISYVVNNDGNKLSAEIFNPDVQECGIWLPHSVTSLSLIPEVDEGLTATVDYGNDEANASGTLEITAMKEPHTIAVKITVEGSGKEPNTYLLNVVVEAKPAEAPKKIKQKANTKKPTINPSYGGSDNSSSGTGSGGGTSSVTPPPGVSPTNPNGTIIINPPSYPPMDQHPKPPGAGANGAGGDTGGFGINIITGE